jgi:transcriptional regulator with GAF, ATPase, and Fis domain
LPITTSQLTEQPPRADAQRNESLDDAIRKAINNALERSEGKIYGLDGAAHALGVKPSTLQSKMRKLGMTRR